MTHFSDINLVPQSVLDRRLDRAWRLRWLSVLVGTAALVSLATVAFRMGTGSGARAVRDDVNRMKAQQAEIEADTTRMTGLIDQAKVSALAATLLADRPDWGQMLTAVDAHRGERVVVTGFGLDVLTGADLGAPSEDDARVELAIAGVSRTLQDAQGFALSIERSGMFDEVSPIRTRPSSFGTEGFVDFELSLKLRGDTSIAEVTP